MFQGGRNDQGEDIVTDITNRVSDDITSIELTQTEFGEAFGMKPNSTFVEHMFLMVDEDKSGHVSFREFMKIFILLSSGNFQDFEWQTNYIS